MSTDVDHTARAFKGDFRTCPGPVFRFFISWLPLSEAINLGKIQ